MKSAQLFGKEDIRIVDIDVPKIKDDEILVKMKAAPLCGTDVRMYKNGYKNVDENNPLTLGHELAGIIAEVGNQVSGYEKGMRVAIAPNMGCGICDQCVSGNTHLCPEYEAFGINLQGGFAEYLVVTKKAVSQGNLTILNDGISFEEAALVEPFSCVFNGQEMMGIEPGNTVLVIGAGPIGIMHAMLAISKGASKVIMNDLQEERLKVARELIPGLITYPNTGIKEGILEETNGLGVDICIVAAPAPKAQEESLDYMAMNGKVLFFGGLPKDREMVALNSNTIHYKQIRIFGSTRASLRQYRTSMKLVESGRVPLGKLISKTYSIDEFEEALENAKNAIGLKNVIVF